MTNVDSAAPWDINVALMLLYSAFIECILASRSSWDTPLLKKKYDY